MIPTEAKGGGYWHWRSLGAGSTFIASVDRSAPVNWFKLPAGNFALIIAPDTILCGMRFVRGAVL
jgi:hypothetical protein